MSATHAVLTNEMLLQLLSEAEATIEALLSDQIDAVVDAQTSTPVLVSKAQDALRDSEERYRRIVETASEGICTLDTERRITFVNEQLTAMLGYDDGELLGQPLSLFVPELYRAGAERRIERALLGKLEDNEVPVARKDATELWAQIKTSPIRDTEGNCIGVLAMLTDRTHHRRAEAALRMSEQQYRQIVETTTDGIITTDRDGRILFVNGRFAELLGYEAPAMVGAVLHDLLGITREPTVDDCPKPQTVHERNTADTTYRHRNGSDVAVNVTLVDLFDPAGTRLGGLRVVRDITEQKRMHSQLMVSDRMASMGTLAAGVAHEINNPLAAVIANLAYITDRIGRGNGQTTSRVSGQYEAMSLEDLGMPLEEAMEAAERVRNIVRDLKVFSRSPNEEPATPVNVVPVMESSLRMAWNEIRHRARLVKTFGEVRGVLASEARLGQVFLNLLVNAAQALPEGRADANRIEVDIRGDGDNVVISVADTGLGIPPNVLPRVFDAFYTTKAIGIGTGLGLAICHRLVAEMNGELTVESEAGRGTTFRVSLPGAELGESTATETLLPERLTARRGRVLVVDDEELILRVVKRSLSNEHDVVTLTSAKEALALCASGERFDLILCDMMMPDMTGLDLHHELTLLSPDMADRMIFVTGGAFTDKARRFLSDPPKEHIEKPFDPANLRAIVRRYLR